MSPVPGPPGPPGPRLETERLVLRRWEARDLAPFAALNGDPETMRYFPEPLTPEASDDLVRRIEAGFERHGMGHWAVELAATGSFLGAIGLSVVQPVLPFAPAVEVGWRLDRRYWGRGYATEAGREALRHAFEGRGVHEVVSFTAAVNRPSQAVMERLGMHRDPAEDFLEPGLPPDHRLQPHVLYRLGREAWAAGA
ncbi:MAG: GNAT family N-acetyltransferase [Acidimicrobiales bacterium]